MVYFCFVFSFPRVSIFLLRAVDGAGLLSAHDKTARTYRIVLCVSLCLHCWLCVSVSVSVCVLGGEWLRSIFTIGQNAIQFVFASLLVYQVSLSHAVIWLSETLSSVRPSAYLPATDGDVTFRPKYMRRVISVSRALCKYLCHQFRPHVTAQFWRKSWLGEWSENNVVSLIGGFKTGRVFGKESSSWRHVGLHKFANPDCTKSLQCSPSFVVCDSNIADFDLLLLKWSETNRLSLPRQYVCVLCIICCLWCNK